MAKQIVQFSINTVSNAGENLLRNYAPVTQIHIQAPEGTKFQLYQGDNSIVIDESGTYTLDVTNLAYLTYLNFSELTGTALVTIACYSNGDQLFPKTEKSYKYYFVSSPENVHSREDRRVDMISHRYTGVQQYIAFAYPAELDKLIGIIDENGFDVSNTFVQSKITIEDELYYQYTLIHPVSVDEFKVSFQFEAWKEI